MHKRKLPFATIRAFHSVTEVRGQDGKTVVPGGRSDPLNLDVLDHALVDKCRFRTRFRHRNDRLLHLVRHGGDNGHARFNLPNPERGIQPQLGDTSAVHPIGNFLQEALLGFSHAENLTPWQMADGGGRKARHPSQQRYRVAVDDQPELCRGLPLGLEMGGEVLEYARHLR